MKKSLLSLFVVGLSLIFSKSANSQNYISGIQVGLGEYVTYFIDNSGTLTAIGNRGYSGVGGNGAGAGSSGVPQAVIVSPSNLKFRSAAGQLHGGAAVDVNGRVWTMGAAAAGESGMGNTNYSQYPQKILTDINGNQFDSVISVVPYAQDYSDGSNRHGWLAVKSTGTLWIWGTPGAMRGDGTENVDQAILRPTKIFIPGGRMVQQIISGDYVLALCTDGTVWTWGKTYRANLGYIPSGMEYASPHQTNLSGITQIAGGKEFNYALKSNGDLYGWGRMGNFMNDPTWPEGTGAEITFPQLMPNIQSYFPAPITKIVTNWSITAALLTDGSLWTWGDNTQGSIGNGESYFGNATTGYVYDYGIHLLRKAPYRVAPTRTFKNIFTGNILGFCTYAVGTDDQLYAWGPNRGSAIPNRIDNPIGGNLGAYNNSWNRPWPQPVDPFNITSTFISTSPLCIANPSGSPCNSYAIPANTKPVANAGSNQSVTGTSAILDGRASTDNVFISYYIWSQVSGPNTAVMDLPGAPVAKVSGLVTGNYVFKLKTIDNGWFSDSTTVQVAVNTTASQPPTANAGTTQTITLPVSQVTLAGNGTANNGGSIINHTWTKFSGGAAAITDPSNYNTTVTGLAAGTYVFRLTVTQNDNQTITSDVTITVNPAVVIPPPTVNAGTTQTITLPASQVTLAGSGTANNGGSIIERTWSKFSGGAANIADPSNYNTTVTGLAAGTYVFRLTVTQNDNQTATSDVTITVNAVNPSGSTPYSGTRKSIPGKLEAEEYDLGGQNIAYNDGTPANLGGAFRTAEGVDVRTCPDAGGGYAIGWTTDGEWMKYSVNVTTSGVYDFAVRAGTPNSGKSVQLQVDDVTVGTLTIVNTGGFNNWQTSTLSNISLTAGDHTFRFLLNTGNVSNPDFGFDINWFSFTIAATPSPTANAGGVQTITLPTTQVTLAGSGTANNGGSIINHTWSKFSGGAAAITDPSNYNTTVTGLAAGTYVFRLTVTQNDNQTATSDVTITVNAVNPSGSTPYGGTRKSIPGKLEAEEYDLGGQNIAYNDGTPSNLGGAFRTAEGVDVRTCPDAGGGYAIGWTTDGEWMKYSVNVTTSGVYDFAVRAGTPNSGKSVQLQVDDVTVGTLTIVNTGGFNTWQTSTLSNLSLSAGNHIFRFLINTGNVSNPDFGFDINWFSFTLASASSVPTANAGVTQTIALPVSQVTLAGNGTANNGGSIINHTWSKFSGGAAAITDPSNYNTTVTGLAAGTYVFRLTVTQNDNQTATSDVTITVNAVNPSGSTPYSGTRKSIPGKLEAEEYDLGGQNIAYNDGTPANLGGAFRTAEGVDVRTCPDAGGGYAIGWTTDGEWMKYSVNVTTSGVYDFAVRAGTPNSGKSVQLQVDDVTVGTLTIVNTGGFNNWQTSTLSNISLTAGDHTFRFLLNTGNVSNPDFGFDINWFSFTIAATPSPTANAGGVQTITLPTTQVTLAGSGTANNGGSIINHTWSKFSGGAAAITDPSNYNTTVTGLAAGTYVFRLTVTQSDNQTATSDVTIIVTPIIVSNGKTIPGKIEAESFDAMNGIQTENTADAGGGMNISWIDNNDWLDYNVNVTTTGTYTVNCRVASPYWGPVFQIRKADGVALATLNVPSTNGWQTWTTVSATVSLTAGPQTLRVVSTNSAGWNFNSMDFVLTSAIAGNAIVNRTILAQPANEVISANTSVGIFPNPVREQFLLKVNNEREGNIQFEIIDQNGRLVKKMQAIKNKGMYQSYISVTGLSQGMYIIKVKMKNWNEAIKMIKL